jgi:DNA-binding CsgD family transcriptional regulator
LTALSARRRQLLALVAEGLTNKEIAEALYISEDTVKATLRITFGQLGAANRAHAVAIAIDSGDVLTDRERQLLERVRVAEAGAAVAHRAGWDAATATLERLSVLDWGRRVAGADPFGQRAAKTFAGILATRYRMPGETTDSDE